ncbi:unnamed protein product, partial [Mycena citricolor]
MLELSRLWCSVPLCLAGFSVPRLPLKVEKRGLDCDLYRAKVRDQLQNYQVFTVCASSGMCSKLPLTSPLMLMAGITPGLKATFHS